MLLVSVLTALSVNIFLGFFFPQIVLYTWAGWILTATLEIGVAHFFLLLFLFPKEKVGLWEVKILNHPVSGFSLQSSVLYAVFGPQNHGYKKTQFCLNCFYKDEVPPLLQGFWWLCFLTSLFHGSDREASDDSGLLKVFLIKEPVLCELLSQTT